jgi:hypothetical protein
VRAARVGWHAAADDKAYFLYNYGSAQTGLFVFRKDAAQPDLVWITNRGQFDWTRAKIAGSGGAIYILYGYDDVDTGLFLFHAHAKEPDLVWNSGLWQFDWNNAKVASSGDTYSSLARSAQPEWKIAATWCTTDPAPYGGGGNDYRNRRSGGNDQYDSVLACQGHNVQAQKAVQTAGRETVNAFLRNAFLPPTFTGTEWKIYARWCVDDPAPWGGGGRDYRNWRSGGNDQYDSVLACQGHNVRAQKAVQTAGRGAVDAFLGPIYTPSKTNPLNLDWPVCVYFSSNFRTAVFNNIHAPYFVNGQANSALFGKTLTFSTGLPCSDKSIYGMPTATITMKITQIEANETLVFNGVKSMIVTGTAP